MAAEVLNKSDYKKLYTLALGLLEVDHADYFLEVLRLLEEIFGWRRTLVFVMDLGDGLAFPRCDYLASRNMSQEYLNSCAEAYQRDTVMYESMKRRRASNEWRGVSFTQDSPDNSYDHSAFMGKLHAMGFAHAATLYLSQSPVACIALCYAEDEGDLSKHDRELVQKVRDTIAAHYNQSRQGARSTTSLGTFDPTSAQKYDLTRREIEVAELVVRGASKQEIARSLHISENTAKVHLANLFRKIEVRNKIDAIKKLTV